MGQIRNYFLAAAFLLSWFGLGFGQTVVLKSGQKVEGRIIEQTDKYVKVEFQGVELTFYDEEVSFIGPDSPDGAKTMTPQMELLYKAYTAAVNSSKVPAQGVAGPGQQPAAGPGQQVTQAKSLMDQLDLAGSPDNPVKPPIDLSQLPPEYQEKIKSVLTQLQGGKSATTEAAK
jgi:hypothetical protein